MQSAARKISTRVLVTVSMLAAISSVLMFFDFPLPFFPSFLKLDVSDLPAMIGAFTLGPVYGVVVELVKNLVHLTQTSSGGIGELANFLVGAGLVFPAGLIYKYKKTQGGALIGMGAGIVAMAIVGAAANYFILIPFYTSFIPLDSIILMCSKIIPAVNSLETVILLSVVPFNIFKGALVSLVTYFTYKKLSGVIRGKNG